jgi:adenylyl cyclase-associated protein
MFRPSESRNPARRRPALGAAPADAQSALLKPLCEAQLAYLHLASQHAASGIAPLLKPQADAIGAIMEAKDKLGRTKEGREWGGCLSVVAEGVSAWGWVQVVSAAVPSTAVLAYGLSYSTPTTD